MAALFSPTEFLAQIDAHATRTPDRPAHISGDRTLTYRELRAASDTMAAWLLTNLPHDNRPVVVYGHKEPELLVAFLGAVKARHPYVPVDSSTPAERLALIVKRSGAGMVLTPEIIADAVATGRQPPPATAQVGPDDPFYIIFTSGSTGEPKGVPITLRALTSFVNWMQAEQQFAAGEVFLNQAPFSFDLSVMDLYPCLLSGGTLCSLNRTQLENPRTLFTALEQAPLVNWISTPSFARFCLAEPRFAQTMLPGMRRFLFCGETLPVETAARLLERFPQAEVWNTYGPTECTVATTSVRITPDLLTRYEALPVGYPKPGSHVAVLGDDDQPVPPGARGEIVIGGEHVTPGYLDEPEKNRSRFTLLTTPDGPVRAYRTGDWGHYRDGLLFCQGRMDFQVKLHGYRIELGDIEAHLRNLPQVHDAVVLPALKHGQAEYLAAFLILAEGGAGGGEGGASAGAPGGPDAEVGAAPADFALIQSLRTALAAHLPGYMLPRRFFTVPSFPLTANGKADRRKLAGVLA